jgi:hypothetical protein
LEGKQFLLRFANGEENGRRFWEEVFDGWRRLGWRKFERKLNESNCVILAELGSLKI